MCVNLYTTPPPDWIVDMQAYSVVSVFHLPLLWQASDGVSVARSISQRLDRLLDQLAQ